MTISTKRIIVVLGMHRSGTSAITRGLQVLGVDLGDNLWPAGPDNPKGFWESSEITSFNESLLKKLNSTIERVGPLDPDLLQSDFLASEKAQAVAILKSKIKDNTIFGFKDPRVTILLPFWKLVFEELDLDDSYVFAVRNPLNIAESLLKRNSIPEINSLYTWYNYIFSGITYTQDKKRIFVKYDDMLENPTKQLDRISNDLSILKTKVYHKNLQEYLENFLELNLRHHHLSNKELVNSNLPEFVIELYLLLDQLSKDVICFTSNDFLQKWNHIEQNYKDFLFIFNMIGTLEMKSARVSAELSENKIFLSNELNDAIRLNNQIENLKNCLSKPIDFDEKFYLKCNYDVMSSNVDPFIHYVRFGIKEGRMGTIPEQKNLGMDPSKSTILLVSHDATRTGAPILALNICSKLKKKYNVISLLLGGGPLFSFFRETSNVVFGPIIKSSEVVNYVINKICERYNIRFCIVNSVDSRSVLKSLHAKDIPTIFLVHEFFGPPFPTDELEDAFRWAGRTVFPSNLVRSSFLNEITQNILSQSSILSPGKSIIPVRTGKCKNDSDPIKEAIFNARSQKNPFIVLGSGIVNLRKGVDLFIDTAIELKLKYPNSSIIMIWIGARSFGPNEEKFNSDLETKLKNPEIKDNLFIFDEIENLEEIYEITDLFYLSSRLDPLPNVTIDAILKGIPVVCFSETTGLIEFLEEDNLTRNCVIPYLNTSAAAEKIFEIYSSKKHLDSLSRMVKKIGEKSFNMDNYIKSIINLAEEECMKCNSLRDKMNA